MSEQKQTIYQKLSDFQGKVTAIRKDKKNPYHKSNYADINTVIAAISEPLRAAGLTWYQQPTLETLITYIIDVETGESISNEIPLINDRNNMQGLGSAITYARRYGLVAVLGLEQEDDDGNGSLRQSKQSKPAKPKKQPFPENKVEEAAKALAANRTNMGQIHDKYMVSDALHTKIVERSAELLNEKNDG